MRLRSALGIVVAITIAAGACGDDGGAGAADAGRPDAGPPTATIVQTLPPHALDVLFVIDNSNGMGGEQLSLTAHVDRFTAALAALPGGLPSLHLGVVSSNVGAGAHPVEGCDGNGDDGLLQHAARDEGCAPPDGAFIAYERDAAGVEHTNVSTSIEETFRCIGLLGTNGCGFEQHLESMVRALDGRNVENAGFLREDAWLAVVILADEDDCSAKDPAIYDPAPMTIDDPLGPVTSFRCFEFGVTCEGARPGREDATLDPLDGVAACVPAGASDDEDDEHLWHPRAYVDVLRSLKVDPTWILAGGILGDVEPVSTSLDDSGNARLDRSSCRVGGESLASPAIRLAGFLRAFAERGTFQSICDDDLSDAIRGVGTVFADAIATPCLTGDVDTDGCTARDAAGAEVAFTLVAAPERCAAYPTGLAVVLADGPSATTVTMTCPGWAEGAR